MLAAMPASLQDDEVAAEMDWLTRPATAWPAGTPEYSSKRLRSDANRKSRGYKSRSRAGRSDPGAWWSDGARIPFGHPPLKKGPPIGTLPERRTFDRVRTSQCS